MGSLGTESILIGHISDGVLDAIGAQVRVAALSHKDICVSNVLQRSLIRGRDSIGRNVAQSVLAVVITNLGVLQDRDVTSIGAGENSN